MKNVSKAALLAAALVGSSTALALEGEALRRELQKIVDESVGGATDVRAMVGNGGVVTLSGYMEELDQLDTLVSRLKEVEGVTDVTIDVTTVD